MDCHGINLRGDSNVLSYGRQRPHRLRASALQQRSVRLTRVLPTCLCFFTSFLWHLRALANTCHTLRGIRTTVVFNTKVFSPDESKPPLWSSDYLEGIGFDESRLCFYADACALDLSEDGTFYTIKSANNEASLVNLKMTRTAPGFVVGKDGKTFFGTDPVNPWGTMWHKFWPRCTLEGEIVTKDGPIDFKGKGMFTHALQGMKPHHAGSFPEDHDSGRYLADSIGAKWNFMNFQSPSYSAVMMEFTTPPSYGSTVVNVGGIALDGEILMAGANHKYEHTETKDDPDWPEPGAVKLLWQGKTKDGKPVQAELSGALKRIDKLDVMAEVPGFIKTIVGGVVG